MILRFVNYLLPVRTYIKSRNERHSKITPPVNLTGAVEKGLNNGIYLQIIEYIFK